ncbi:unnamed protein product [Mytilus coruscus]|uniref:Tesmin/TSO1-like CXC domain-containing protein n=1 Tax=Mytilus coruscus TaxID=42192 RepID=A0A6J8E4A7_MYTCO|nr:unnamed protein product [Mytilus coruscus]
MSGRSSCSKLHPERRPGPCAYCNNDHISNRYIHLIQKASDLPDFTNFVSSKYKIAELDCICRKCEGKLKKAFSRVQNDSHTEPEVSPLKKTCTETDKSDAAEDQLSQTTEYLFSCLENFTVIDTEKVTTENIDSFSFRSVLESVINSFVEEKALLLPNLYEQYKCILHKNAKKLGLCVEQVFHRPQWLFTMLKSCLGRALSYYVPKKKNLGRMIYRNGTDIFGCLHTVVVENLKCIDDNKRLKKESIIQAEKMASTVSAESRKNKQEQSLEDANSQCVQPLHLLYTDIADKFSNSSSTFLSINARLGAGISKDSLRRYITNRCRELEQKQRYILSDSFIVASFDNLDKKPGLLCMAILDETADSKETVLKVLNILNDKFQVGQLTNYVVVVGDGKSYDHLIKLKSEYGGKHGLGTCLPGDWHILKNVLPIFVKIYFDAELKQLATKHHHGATLKVLTECSKFAITHRFFYTSLGSSYETSGEILFEYKSCESPYDIQVSDLILDIISDMSLDEGEDDVCKTDVWEKVPKAPVSSKTTVIIDGMFIINTSPLASHQTFGDYAGGFDDDRKDRAISILNGQVVDYDLASGNHEEADTRVWLHASVTTADQVIIYSPDTDVFFIGLPLVPNLTKTVYVQLRDSPYNNSFLSMDKLVKCITLNDSLLQGIDSILICMQLLFVYSGCDFVSYFRGCGKKTFFDVFRKHASCIEGNGSFADVDGHNDIHSFYRLICSKVEKTVEWYTKGCGCKTGCKTNRCKCKKAQNENCDGFCGPGCKCVNCFNVPGSGDQVLDMSIDLDDVISDETEDLEDPVEDEQPEVDGLVEELDQTDDYWLFSNEEI